MAGEWRDTAIGEFASFAYGKPLPEHRRDSSGDVHVFGSNGVIGFHGEALACGPTVIIGRKGTVGVHYSQTHAGPLIRLSTWSIRTQRCSASSTTC